MPNLTHLGSKGLTDLASTDEFSRVLRSVRMHLYTDYEFISHAAFLYSLLRCTRASLSIIWTCSSTSRCLRLLMPSISMQANRELRSMPS